MANRLTTPQRTMGIPSVFGIVLLVFSLTSCTSGKRSTKEESDQPPRFRPLRMSGGIPFVPNLAKVDEQEMMTPVDAREVIIPRKKLPGLIKPVTIDSRGQPLSLAIRKWSND